LNNIDRIYQIADSLSGLINCRNCKLCEGESVYLMPWEKKVFSQEYREKVSVVDIDGIGYLQHQNGQCPFFDDTKSRHNCLVYSKRPFCCRLYPLGLFNDSGIAKWGVYKHCPSVKKIQPLTFRLYAKMLEDALGPINCEYLFNEDIVGSFAENLQGQSRFIKNQSRFTEVKVLSNR
jgi:Fe-S-cluster containining protein